MASANPSSLTPGFGASFLPASSARPVVYINMYSVFAPQWVFSNNLDLSKFKGNVYIAFRYEGNDPSVAIGKLTTSFRLDKIMVQGN